MTRDPIKDGRNWFAYCENNPLKFVDPQGLDPLGIALDVALYAGATAWAAGEIRSSYIRIVHGLDPGDVAARTAAKENARKRTPTVVRKVIEGARPGMSPRHGATSSANKTNAAADKIGGALKHGGRVLTAVSVAADVYDVAQSRNPQKDAFIAFFGNVGAMTGGTAGAMAGTGVGSIPLAIGGSALGSSAARAFARWLYEVFGG